MSINKKKGISLCSKDFNTNAKSQIKSTSVDPNKTNSVYNTSLYPLHTEESVEKNKKSTKLGHYKKVKIGYKNSIEKGSSLSQYEKATKPSGAINTIHNGWFIN